MPQASKRSSRRARRRTLMCTALRVRVAHGADLNLRHSLAPAVASIRNIIYNAPSARARLHSEQVRRRHLSKHICKRNTFHHAAHHHTTPPLRHKCRPRAFFYTSLVLPVLSIECDHSSSGTSIAAICHGLTILKKCALSLTFAPLILSAIFCMKST